MTRYRFLAVAFVAAACGSVKERSDCATSAGCPPGEYCAHTPEGSVCWPDAVSPTVTGVTVTCEPESCVRDGQLMVTAQVDDDAEVFAVEATADVDPAHAFPLTRQTGTTWSGTIALAQLDFPAFARETVVTVRALDGARNEASAPAAQRPVVTRVRWSYSAGASLTAPAIMPDGDVVVGRNALTDQLVGVHPDGVFAWSLTVGGAAVTEAPSIGAQAIWVGANDGKLYGVKPDGSGELSPSRTCTASGVAKGPPAVLTTAGVDVAFGAFANGRITASTSSSCAQTPLRDPFSGGAAIGLTGNVLGTTANAGVAGLRSFSWDGAAFEELWSAGVGATVTATPAFDADGRILTVGQDGGVDRTTAAGVTAPLATLSGSIDDSPIILSDGDLVVGDASGKLHRLTPDGTEVAGWPVDLGAAVHAPMALSGGPVRFLAATDDGRVHALADDGTVLWSGALTSGLALGAGNLHTPPGSAFSTAYFSGADGKLYAVVVEGALDTSAPWPKAWHDPRNTSRAGGAF
jgi:hypothetical protein